MKIIDPAALATPRSPVCEYCGCYCRKDTERHHIISRGMGGGNRLDIPENLVDLGGAFDCDCHNRAQEGKIHKDALFEVVAMKLGSTFPQIKAKVMKLAKSPRDPLHGSARVKKMPGKK